jgi:formate hydrogenlyase subunit 4
MDLFLSLVAQLLHGAVMLTAPPLLSGVAHWLTARLSGGAGPSPLQPWRDLRRLANKQTVLAEGVSPLFRLAPSAAFAAAGGAAMLVPSFTRGMAAVPAADLLVIAGLILTSRAVLALAALDTGTAFGGIGASRTMLISVCAEPVLLTIFFAFAALAGSSNIGAIAAAAGEARGAFAPNLLAVSALLCVIVAENGSLRAGEYAMAEIGSGDAALALEYAGRDLALVKAAAMLKRLLWLSLVVALFFPFGMAPPGASPVEWLPALLAWAVKLCLLTAVLAVFETALARQRLARVPAFLGVALLLAILSAALVLASQVAA